MIVFTDKKRLEERLVRLTVHIPQRVYDKLLKLAYSHGFVGSEERVISQLLEKIVDEVNGHE